MASKIVVFLLIVTICKVRSQAVITGYQNPAPANAKAPATNTQAATGQQQIGTKTTQTQSLPCNGNGVTAYPQLKILPGQVKTIPLSRLMEYLQNQGRPQNCGIAPVTGNTVVQGNQTPQVQFTPVKVTSPSLGIQPSACGTPSVITTPVSPSGSSTVCDCNLSTSLANCLQMLIAENFLNSFAGSNVINQECIQIPVKEALVPGVDLSSLTCAQTQPSQPQSYYDWATIQNFLTQKNEQVSPVVSQPQAETTSPDITALISYLNQNTRIDQPVNQQPQPYQQTYCEPANNDVIEALAAYFGCSPSEVSSNSYPYAPELQFPSEIPCQLLCKYGYMPTIVPAVKFTVEPLDCEDGFIVGCQI